MSACWAKNFLDYTFTNAPVDWFADGTWLPTMRWACKPQYSFYSGWSRGDAVLWHKRRFYGDQSLQAFTAFKMEYPRETNFYDQYARYHDMCLTICGDGHDPRSGYAICSGLPDAAGTPNAAHRAAAQWRAGGEIADVHRRQGAIHNWWYDMELRKRGDMVEFILTNMENLANRTETVISYRDPHPIDGGVPAIWTTDNGVSIARVRIAFRRRRSSLNHDPHVYLDTPWFPEWANVGQPLQLDFSAAFSTTGQPVALRVKDARRAAPEKDHCRRWREAASPSPRTVRATTGTRSTPPMARTSRRPSTCSCPPTTRRPAAMIHTRCCSIVLMKGAGMSCTITGMAARRLICTSRPTRAPAGCPGKGCPSMAVTPCTATARCANCWHSSASVPHH